MKGKGPAARGHAVDEDGPCVVEEGSQHTGRLDQQQVRIVPSWGQVCSPQEAKRLELGLNWAWTLGLLEFGFGP